MTIEGAFSWLSELLRYLAKWFPHPIKVTPIERVVKLRTTSFFMFWRKEWWSRFYWLRGPVPKPQAFKAGFYWYVPQLTDIHSWMVVPYPLDIVEKPAMTKDGQAVTVDATVVGYVRAPLRASLKCHDLDEMVQTQAIPELRYMVNQNTLAELGDYLVEATVDEDVTNGVRDRMQKYGFYVEEVLVSVCPTTAMHHVGLSIQASATAGKTDE